VRFALPGKNRPARQFGRWVVGKRQGKLFKKAFKKLAKEKPKPKNA